MNAKEENINLGYEVARLVFNKHAFEPHHINNAICDICRRDCRDDVHIWPDYPNDPAAAMEVLKKCIQKLGDDCRDLQSGFCESASELRSMGFDQWSLGTIFREANRGNGHDTTWAPTLELAICLFAKKIFTK